MIPMHDYQLGGLGFSLHNIGTVLAIVGFLMIPFSLLSFAPVSVDNHSSCICTVCMCVPCWAKLVCTNLF